MQYQMHNAIRDYAAMAADELMAGRLRQAREDIAKIPTATAAAQRYGWIVPTYLSHENGSRGFSVKRAKVYAKVYRVNLQWLVTGDGTPIIGRLMPLTGYVGNGAIILPLGEETDIDEVEAPPGVNADLLAFQIKGDSNYPVYKGRDIVYCLSDGGSPADFIGRECVLRLADGRRFLKTLQKGSASGLFTLISYNSPAMPDQAVEWASPVEWIKRS